MNNQGCTAPTKIPKDIKMVKEEAPPSVRDGGRSRHGQRHGRSWWRGRRRHGRPGIGPGGGAGCAAEADWPGPRFERCYRRHCRSSQPEPVYPPIAKAARVSGTVVLQAIISKTGTIENLRWSAGRRCCSSRPWMQSERWRYKPYLLNNEPVEVETTINVNFTLGG